MFPPTMPHVFIRWLTRKGDVVWDPFSGRGTTPLEASLLGRVGLGSDANPLARILTAAKVDPPLEGSLMRRLSELRRSAGMGDPSTEPTHIRDLFQSKTFSQLLWLREELRPTRKTDRFLLAALMGILHANARTNGQPRGLTVAMPNTFSMAPRYVQRYVREHKLRPPEVDVFDALEARLGRLTFPNCSFAKGRAWQQDVMLMPRWPKGLAKAKLIFTSPPYLQVMKYGKLNWLRLWLIGIAPGDVDRKLFASSSVPRYLEFMTAALKSMENGLRADGYVCLVVGDVRKGERDINLAREVVRECVVNTRLRVLGTVVDRLPIQHKVSRIWKENKGRATKTDRILILAGPNAAELPPPPRVEWSA